MIDLDGSESGIYHIVFKVEKEFIAKVGAAGQYLFVKGYYVYTGTAQRALKARLDHHIEKDKKIRWHIDYLSSHPLASFAAAYYYEGEAAYKECRRNRKIIINANFYLAKFGSGDCRMCPSHLAGFNKLSDFKKLLDEGVSEYKPVSGTNK